MSKAKDLNEMQEWLIKRISTSLRVKNGISGRSIFEIRIAIHRCSHFGDGN
jgi:hypothetical protein